jgi:hypothetical protein
VGVGRSNLRRGRGSPQNAVSLKRTAIKAVPSLRAMPAGRLRIRRIERHDAHEIEALAARLRGPARGVPE